MSIGANAVFRPHNAVSAALIRFVPNFVALRLSWTQNSLRSEGLEQFVEEFLPIIRENNPQVKYFLHRTYTECDPFVYGEYTWLRSRRKRVSWRSKHQVLSMVEEMAVGGDYRPGLKRGVNKRLPRGQELWDTETIGHDVFKKEATKRGSYMLRNDSKTHRETLAVTTNISAVVVHSKWKADDDDLQMPTAQNHPHFVYRKY